MNSAIIMAGTRTISIFGVNFTMQNLINYLNETTYTRVRINYTYIQTYNTPPLWLRKYKYARVIINTRAV